MYVSGLGGGSGKSDMSGRQAGIKRWAMYKYKQPVAVGNVSRKP